MRCSRSKSVTQVNSCVPMELLSGKGLLKDILTGECSKEALQVCQINDLQHLIFEIIDMHTATDAHTDPMPKTKPLWWSDDVLSFSDLQNVQSEVQQVIQDWHNMLIMMLDSCTQYYKNSTSKPLKAVQRQTSMDLSKTPSETPNKMLLKMTSDKTLDLAITPVVILTDVIKAHFPILETEDYIDFLKLQPTETLPSTLIEKTSLNLQSNRDDGFKKSLKKNNNVIYKPKKNASTCERRYVFPHRQQRQRKNALEALKKTVFKPVTVRLERFNIQPYLIKMKLCRQFSVNIDRTETDQKILEIHFSSVTSK